MYFSVVDFRRAHDYIWREAIFKKLLGYGNSTDFVSLLKNMYEKARGIREFFPSNVGLK